MTSGFFKHSFENNRNSYRTRCRYKNKLFNDTDVRRIKRVKIVKALEPTPSRFWEGVGLASSEQITEVFDQ